ncbi:cell division protein ZapE, partial [Stutzerimonas stutzeri]|nr:cell division protein ZapE [Stutzerimonas stutzeri]
MTMHDDSPLQRYQQALAQGGFVPDPAQQRAAQLLEACHQALRCADGAPSGVYL